uniref:Uncharacterized protein n=1 Tax=Magallana gigas TaxID=29159 RepID=K1PDH4_MAGGI
MHQNIELADGKAPKSRIFVTGISDIRKRVAKRRDRFQLFRGESTGRYPGDVMGKLKGSNTDRPPARHANQSTLPDTFIYFDEFSLVRWT